MAAAKRGTGKEAEAVLPSPDSGVAGNQLSLPLPFRPEHRLQRFEAVRSRDATSLTADFGGAERRGGERLDSLSSPLPRRFYRKDGDIRTSRIIECAIRE